MSRRKKKSHYKVHAGGSDKLLIALHEIVKKPGSDRETAQSLLTWYLRHKYWTDKQITLVNGLIARNKNKVILKPVKYHLYAIGDGECVKLGISTDIPKRLKSMQTGHPKTLKVLWKFFVGRERKPAYSAEKKLHRYCKRYKLRGEWFKSGCLDIVKQFTIREKALMKGEQEQYDDDLIANHMDKM